MCIMVCACLCSRMCMRGRMHEHDLKKKTVSTEHSSEIYWMHLDRYKYVFLCYNLSFVKEVQKC